MSEQSNAETNLSNSSHFVFRSLREEMLAELERLRQIMREFDIEKDEDYLKLTEEEKERFNNFLKFFSACPVCHRENHKRYLKDFYFSKDQEKNQLKCLLVKLMDEAKDFNALYGNKIELGIPCCECFKTIFVTNTFP